MTDHYFDHLMFVCAIGSLRRPYLRVCAELYRRPFYATVPMDEDRIANAESVYEEWSRENPEWGGGMHTVSVLEVLVQIATELADQMGRPGDSDDPGAWLMEMLENMGLTEYEDCVFSDLHGVSGVRDACEKLLNRTYDAQGNGGPFPQNSSRFDARYEDLWTQACRYLAEKYEVW